MTSLSLKSKPLWGNAQKWRKQLPGAYPYDALIPPTVEDKIKELKAYSNITVKTETEVARIAGEPGDFTVTLKKPGEKTEFDVPFPLPDEMKLDDKGNELNAEQLHEKFMEYNEGKQDILTFDPDGEGEAPEQQGEYLTVWKKVDGTWYCALDSGTTIKEEEE